MTMLKDIALDKDKYTCLETVAGEGSQAVVYKVKRDRDQAVFALKVAKVWRNPKSETLLANTLINYNCERIKMEIAFLQQLKEADDNFIVQLVDQGQVSLGGYDCPAFVMPWYQTSITKALLNPPQPSLQQRLQWIRQMIGALRYIHRQNDLNGESLVHRDFKLDNLLLDDNQRVRLVDFGISKNLQRSTNPSATKINYTPDCVAPEQVFIATPNTDGEKKVAIGTHTDMYALGLVIYYLITLEHPSAQQHFATNIDTLVEEHIKGLNADGVGLLGKVEGLNEQDENALRVAFIKLMTGPENTINEVTDSGTFLDWDDDETGDTASIDEVKTPEATKQTADDFVTFVRSMTDAEHSYRKDATSAGYWIESIIQRVDRQNENSAYTSNRQKKEPSQSTETYQTATMSSDVGDMPESDETQESPFKVTRQPRKQDNSSPTTSSIGQSLKKKKVLAGGAAALALLVGAVTFSQFGDEPQPVIPTPAPNPGPAIPPKPVMIIPPELFAPSEDIQQRAWQALYNRSHENTEAKQQLNAYEEQINQWINSDNQDDWAKAIPGLKRAAWVQDINATLWLAYAFQEGRGIPVDWGKSWEKYNELAVGQGNAIAKQQQQKLEQSAYRIVQNKNSVQSQKNLAYQVIEARAINKPTKDSAHLWMAYRHQEGDGIAMDLERAQYWKNRHDGVLVESILKGNEN